MTTSGNPVFELTALEVIEQAFHKLGKASEGEAMTARMYGDGLSALNLMLKTMNADEHLWQMQERTLTMVAGQAAYTLTPKPLRVLSVRRMRQTIETPMNRLSRQVYFDQPNKTASPSIPVSYYYDPQQASGVLYLWPAPSAATIADYTINMTVVRRFDAVTSTGQTLDVPEEWQEAIVWGLADRLETEYPVNDSRLAGKVTAYAVATYNALRSWDNENASIMLQPDVRM